MRSVALITGCAKGIGREIALTLARDGYDIIGTYLTSEDDILSLKKKIEFIGVKFDYYKLDLSNESEINSFCNSIKNKYKNIDILINNAALSMDCEFEDKTKEEFMKDLEVNLVGPFLLIKNL